MPCRLRLGELKGEGCHAEVAAILIVPTRPRLAGDAIGIPVVTFPVSKLATLRRR
jgi:hypothetical protein